MNDFSLEIKQILNKYIDVKIHSITDIGEALDETIINDDNLARKHAIEIIRNIKI